VAQHLDHADTLTGNADLLSTTGPVMLAIGDGTIGLRPERAGDEGFLAALFRDTALAELALMPVDDATKEALVCMQFASQTATYRSRFPRARFDIVERDGEPIGRLVTDPGGADAGCIVDFALLPDHRAHGLGSAILRAVLAQFAGARRRVRCKVLAGNEPSLRMCRRVGFTEVEAVPPFLQLEWRPPVS
jgi:RimJ/RimL family protein N-acetyltransferase